MLASSSRPHTSRLIVNSFVKHRNITSAVPIATSEMSATTAETKPPLPPFTRETAIQKIRMAGKTMLYSAFVGF